MVGGGNPYGLWLRHEADLVQDGIWQPAPLMQRPSIPWFWILMAAILLLAPGPAGRLLLDLLGGITITILVAPLFLAAVGFVGWQILQRRIRQCPACGFSGVGGTVCPACGTLYQEGSNGSAGEPLGAPVAPAQVVDRLVDLDASQVTIDVRATDVED